MRYIPVDGGVPPCLPCAGPLVVPEPPGPRLSTLVPSETGQLFAFKTGAEASGREGTQPECKNCERVFCVWAPGCTTYKNALWSILSIHRPRHRLYCLRAPWLVSKIVLGVSRLRVPSRRVFVTDECPGVSRLVRRLLAEFCSKIARNHNDQCQLRTSRGII